MTDRLATPLLTPAAARTGPVLELPRARFDLTQRVLVVGIVNRTSDSFYDRGATAAEADAITRAMQVLDEGADIVDIGGVKGGPGAEVSADEERERVVPVVVAVRAARPDAVVSVDTFRAAVADAALEAGADLVNDVSGGSDPQILDVVAAHGAGYVAMHHGGVARTRPLRPAYPGGVVAEVVRHCGDLAARAIEAGVHPGRVIVDPGHDFQKTTWHSLELTRRLPELAALGYPVLVALSNKDFIGETLDRGLDERVDGSIAAAVISIVRGARLVRVHEVARTVDAVRMTEAVLGWRAPAVAVRGLE